jgi:predicted house-cleaning noncanonical NTP pyrophosphatase (MazG superfamily)
MDLATLIIGFAALACALATIGYNAWFLYTSYKGKKRLTIDEIVNLTKDLTQLANNVELTLSDFKKTRYDFATDEEYREYLTNSLIEHFDETMSLFNSEEIASSKLYSRLSQEEKASIIETLIDKIPDSKEDKNLTEDTDEETTEESTSSDMTDMTDYL